MDCLSCLSVRAWAYKAVLQKAHDDFSIADEFAIYSEGDALHIFVDGSHVKTEEAPRFPEAEVEDIPGGCVAPMPGRVVQLNVNLGECVEAGQILVVLEAMKMEQSLSAPVSGTVVAVNCAEGDVVEAGVVLVRVEDEASDEWGMPEPADAQDAIHAALFRRHNHHRTGLIFSVFHAI